jgi:hypothetical protein
VRYIIRNDATKENDITKLYPYIEKNKTTENDKIMSKIRDVFEIKIKD